MNPERLRIGLFSAYPMIDGGVQTHIKESAKFLTNQGHEVLIFAPSFGRSKPSEIVNVIHLGKGVKFPIRIEGTEAVIALFRVPEDQIRRLQEEHPLDIAHLHEAEIAWPLLQYLKSSQAKLNVITFHAVKKGVLIYYLFKTLIPHYGSKLDARIAVSQAAKEFVQRYFPGEYQIIPNGVDTSRFHPDVSPIPRFADGKLNILYVGRLEERKGVKHLIEAFARLRREKDNIRLIIVGKGPLEGRLRKQVESQNVSDVCFEGQVPACDLSEYYSSADICSFPSEHGESFGIVLLEAMASGKAVVAGDNAGYRGLIANEQNGFLVDPANTLQFADQMQKLLDNQNLREQFGENGRKTAERYDWRVVSKQLLDFYLEKLKDKGLC